MKLHLVGGFLGSGKTTAIIQAARSLMDRGLRVGVLTNDQGKYLVDTAFVRLANIPAVEVTGGCFCCNYADLDHSLDQLIETVHPDVIFAESVGSCADLVATVVKPLLELKNKLVTPTSFSVFADGRLLRRFLVGDPMPFSYDVVYIYEKQIEEAGLVVVNKIDLMSAESLEVTTNLLHNRYPQKIILAQNSRHAEGVMDWLSILEEGIGILPNVSLEIDYEQYGRGEACLAWLDEEVQLRGDANAYAVRSIIGRFADALRQEKVAIGHLKFLIRSGEIEAKISFPTLEEPGWENNIPEYLSNPTRLLVNARVEMPAEALHRLFFDTLTHSGAVYEENGVSFFHPSQPNPMHRYR
jgi:Ni2+-binding GTPase involved in maturation of urease and hydrogenase